MRNKRQCAAVSFGLLFLIRAACGDVLPTPESYAYAETCVGLNTASPFSCNVGQALQIAFNSPSVESLSGSYGSLAAGASLTGNASAQAAYGVMRASSASTFDISGTTGGAGAVGSALFLDDLTISSPSFNGSNGLLYLTYTLDGNTASSGVGSAHGEVDVYFGSTTNQVWDTAYNGSVSGAYTHEFTFIFGDPFILEFNLYADSGTWSDSGGVASFNTSAYGTGSGSADFSNTLVLSGLAVTGADGSPVTDASFTSTSGTRYGPGGVVPEPRLVLLLATLLTAMFACRRLSRHSSSQMDTRPRNTQSD